MLMKSKPVFGSMPFGKRDARFLFVAYFDPNGIETIPQNIQAWQSLSRHELVLLNLWPGRPVGMRLPNGLRLEAFDGIIIHPTVSYSPQTVEHLDAALDPGLAAFDGVKVLMKQDEQVLAGRLAPLVRDKGFDIVMTCLAPAEQDKVYPRSVIGDCALVHVLTGYVSPGMRSGWKPLTRDIDLSYRGSIQPLEFGRLGFEKRGIGYDMSAALGRHPAIRFDISSRWEDRLSGTTWSDFLSRSNVVLGAESGANLFDFDGQVARWCCDYAARHQADDVSSFAYYKRADDEFLHTFEGNVHYAQISPRHFEAASVGAAQLLYAGEYSGIFKPNKHFFPLRQDLGNVDEAVDFLKDKAKQRQMADCAFDEIVLDRANWYEHFVSIADDALDAKLEAKWGRRRSSQGARKRPLAYVVAPHDPVLDPRIGWFASSLAKTHDVVVVGTYLYTEVGDGPSVETDAAGITRVRVERTRHGGAWLPSARRVREGQSEARALLAELVAYAAAPHDVLAERLGAEVAVSSELQRFRQLCLHMVNTSSALIGGLEQLGTPDVIIAADMDALFAAAIFGEENSCPVVYDAHEYWPYSMLDFQHWEIDFWQSIERRLCSKTALRLAVTPQLAQIMGEEYGCAFRSLPNAASLQEGALANLEDAFWRRRQDAPLRVLYQGAFAPGRGLEEAIRAWPMVKSGARLLLRGPDNPYRQQLIALARTLGVEARGVEFPAAVREHQLVEAALEADVGLIPYHPRFFAHRYCCPNKLSQLAAAGLPIISSRTEFVGKMITDSDIGYVTDIEKPEELAALVDSISTRRAELVLMGRKARGLFERQFNWDHLVAPVLDEIGKLRAEKPSRGPDLSWIERPRGGTIEPGDVEPLPSTVFGTRPSNDVADVGLGASIIASSPFHASPNDAGFVLREDDPNGYAAALTGTSLPHWFEVDLGQKRAVRKAAIIWYGPDRYATTYRMLSREDAGEPWELLFQAADNRTVDVHHAFEARWARFVRLEVSAFEGDPRLLIRAFRLATGGSVGSVRETPERTVASVPSSPGAPRPTSASRAAPAESIASRTATRIRRDVGRLARRFLAAIRR